MRIGLAVPPPGENPDLATFLTRIERADALGLHSIWMPNVSARGFDALYRAILDKAGAAGPEDVALVGDEATVRAGITDFAAAGATDFSAAIFRPAGEDGERTLSLLAALASDARRPLA